jgi:serine protease Do
MAEKLWDRCPKCSSKLTNKVECRTCGILFDKYFQAEARKKAQAEKEAAKAGKSRRLPVLISTAVLLIMAVASTFYFLGRKSSSPLQSQTVKPAVVREGPAVQPPAVQTVHVQNTTGRDPIRGGDDKRFIQKASHATVTVQTAWGTGSGFFIGENSIITNKHVVEVNKEILEEKEKDIEKARKYWDLEAQSIEEYKQSMSSLPNGPTKNQRAMIIQMRQERLKKALPELKEKEKQLAEMKERSSSSDIKVIMSDGKEHSVSNIVTSNTYDLALLKVYSAKVEFLKRGPIGYHLQQGDTVYTVGSPRGLMNTVTSGVFSGYRKRTDTNEVFLQTDAPINPGNSGGPLIDGHGNVCGVNTLKRLDAEGIGYAIPIDTVYEEFGNAL